MAGWIKLRKDIASTWLWSDSEKLKWYVDLTMLASEKDRDGVLKGQVDHTVTSLAKRWESNRMTVSRFLHRLDESDLIILFESPYMLQGVLQKVLRIFVRDFNELRETMLQKVLQHVLHPQKEEAPTPPEENIIQEQEKENNSEYKNIDIFNSSLSKKNRESERYSNFCRWVELNAPWCHTNLKMMTEVEFYKLVSVYSSEQVADKILELENYSKRNSYKSIYLTINKWLKRDNGAAI